MNETIMSAKQYEGIMDRFSSVKDALEKAIDSIEGEEKQKADTSDSILDLVIVKCLGLYSRWDTLQYDGSLENRVNRLVTEFLENEGFGYE